jgi:hypothetical protein
VVIQESEIRRNWPTHCECGIKLRTAVEKQTQLCEECEREQAEYFENC